MELQQVISQSSASSAQLANFNNLAAQHVVEEEEIESLVKPASESSQPPPTESPIPPQQSPLVTPRT